jgi:two-component system, sensor histidine kinase and response regulator
MNFAHPFAGSQDDRSHRILVVDDNQSIHDDFRKILAPRPARDEFEAAEDAFFGAPEPFVAKDSFELVFASQGLEALDLVAEATHGGRRYEVVFMDVRMPPGLDGIETTARLWEIDPDLQVVICTAYSDYSWEQMIGRLGRTDRLLILKKPFDMIEVVQCAHALAEKWSLLQQTRRHAESLESSVRERTLELEATLGELSDARDAAVESVRLKSRFLANMSHEIRTPMNGVIGMAELLLHTNLNRDQRDYVDTIRSSADSLLSLINDLLDSSKIESGMFNFETLEFDLAEIVEGVLDIVGGGARSKGLELACHFHDEVPRYLRGDAGRLRQVLVNILGNAVKFTAEGEVVLTVSLLEEAETAARLRFEVKDTGIGIAEDFRERVFEPFVQADGSDTRKHGGTGLGLSICRQIVEAQGGEIGVESEPGKGSTFWFQLAFGKNAAPPRQVPVGIDCPKDLRVLVVDDNATNRKILQLQLANLQMRSSGRSSGDEAIELLRRENAGPDPFHLAIIDMQMPGMDGLSVARLIKSDPAISATRLIILSSLGDQFSDDELAAAGVEGHLAKPIKQGRLHESLRALFRHPLSPPPQASAAVLQSAEPKVAPALPLRILLAEDNPVNQKVALLQLKNLGYEADLAEDGAQALEMLERQPYDVILMDCQMPVMDGLAATRAIRRSYPQPVRIIAMTANAMQGDRERCLEAGMDAFLSKPVRAADLDRVLQECRPLISPGGPALPPDLPEGPTVPVNLERLTEITGRNTAMFQQIVHDYLEQAGEILSSMALAIEDRSATEVRELAHKLCGSSDSCGMQAIVPPLRRLEQLGRAGQFDQAHELHQDAVRQLNRIRRFLAGQVVVTSPALSNP